MALARIIGKEGQGSDRAEGQLSGGRLDVPPFRLLQFTAEARAIAIRGDDGVFGGDKDRCSLELRYPADTPIAFRDITPAQVVDSYACHINPVTMLENVLQVLNSEVASRGALSRMLRKEQ